MGDLMIKPMMAKESVKPEKDYICSVNFTTKDLPEIKSWKVGGKYTLQIEVEQVSLRKGGYYDENPDQISASFNIKSVKAVESDKSSDESEDKSEETTEIYKDGGKIKTTKVIKKSM